MPIHLAAMTSIVSYDLSCNLESFLAICLQSSIIKHLFFTTDKNYSFNLAILWEGGKFSKAKIASLHKYFVPKELNGIHHI